METSNELECYKEKEIPKTTFYENDEKFRILEVSTLRKMTPITQNNCISLSSCLSQLLHKVNTISIPTQNECIIGYLE